MNSFLASRVAPEKAAFRPALALGSLPGVNGTHMGKMTYGEQLRHPNWQRLRLKMLDGAGWRCQGCGDKETTLHVHHKRYIKGRMAWEYEDSNFAVLCDPCHSAAHEDMDHLLLILSLVGTEHLKFCGALLAGWLFSEAAPEDLVAMGDTDPRTSTVGVLASELYVSRLSHEELGDLSIAINGPRFEELRAVIAAAKKDIDDEVARDA